MISLNRGHGGTPLAGSLREPGLRADFRKALETKVDQFLGPKGSDRRTILEPTFEQVMTEGKFDLSKMPTTAKRELARLEKASEDFEAHFVKGLMAQMRTTSLGGEDSGMAGFAKEQFDAAVAEAVASGGGSIGIAKSVFLSMGEHVVRQAVGTQVSSMTDQKPSTRNG